MSLLVVGLSHRSAPVSVLERASLSPEAQTKLLQDTLAAEPATEGAVLATCNRIELYADVDKFHAGVAELSTLLAQHSGVGLDELTPYLYVHYEDRAVHHLFSVACGLDSMVVGEGQILGQIKDALALGQELHTAGRLLNDLFQQALRVGKRAHSETGIDRAGQSLVTFGLEQLADGTEVTEWAAGKRALVIGAGSMSSLAAATLVRTGVAEIVVANRTRGRADRLVEILAQSGGATARAVEMTAVPDELTRADVVVSCTGATGLVLTAEAVAGALGVDFDTAAEPSAARAAAAPATWTSTPRGWRTVPPPPPHRTVPCAGYPCGARPPGPRGSPCSTSPCRGTSTGRPTASTVCASSTSSRSPRRPRTPRWPPMWTRCAPSSPTRWRPSVPPSVPPTSPRPSSPCAPWPPMWWPHEIARLDGRLPDLDEKQRAEITQTVRRVVDKLLHAPTVRVKQLASEPGGAGYADALRELFDLDPQTVAAVSRADLNDPNRGRS